MDHMHQQENQRSRKGKSPAAPSSTLSSEPPRTCPRCDSANTKFCYYNNYSSSQPRYFCRACRRYWTQGGTIRNLPHASTVRRGVKLAKRPAPTPHSSSATSSTSLPHLHLHVSTTATSEIVTPWSFSGAGFFRQPMGYSSSPIPRLSQAPPEMGRVLNPGLVLGPPAPTAVAEAGEDSERFFSGLFPGFQDVSGGEAPARGTPATSSGPFI